MSLIAGIDFSTRAVDVVLLDEDTNHAGWLRFQLPLTEVEDAFDRTRRLRDVMPSRAWWRDEGIIAIGIEQPRGRHGVTPLFRVQGAILACLPRDLLVQPWNPASWRKAVGLPGNATKDQVREAAILLGANREWDVFDPFDALCIAHATRSVLERQEAA